MHIYIYIYTCTTGGGNLFPLRQGLVQSCSSLSFADCIFHRNILHIVNTLV